MSTQNGLMKEAFSVSEAAASISSELSCRKFAYQILWFNVTCSIVSALAIVVIAAGYLIAAFPGEDWTALEIHNYFHVATALLANLACVQLALNTHGSLNTRLVKSLVYVAFVYMAIVILLFGFRLYYSRTIIVLSIFTSLSLVTIVSLIAERYRPLRVGVIPQGLSEDMAVWLGPNTIVIDTNKNKVTDFDLILTNWSSPLEQVWMSFICQALLSGRQVRHIPEYVEHRARRVLPEHFEPVHAHSVWLTPYKRNLKRCLDVFLVLLSLPVTIPVMILACIMIRISMGSPVLFTQDRVGLGGRIFKMYKLRTMRPSNTSSTTATSQQDNRITSLGKFLRRHRIDELPQFYNILRGDMSLVGPRPEQPSLAQRYLETIPSFRYRCMLPPGITGWAQINASYASDETETHRKLTYDLYYVKHAGLLLDLWIILITVRAVLLRQGAR